MPNCSALKNAIVFMMLVLSGVPMLAQFHLKVGGTYSHVLGSNLVFSNEDRTRTYFPAEAFSGSMILAPVGLGWSGADESLDAGVSAAFGSINVTSEGKSDQLSVIFPAVYLDMYFFNRSALFLGGGLEVRYSSIDLKRTFAMDFDDVLGTEDYTADMRWAGAGYKLSLKGKYLLENNPLALNFGVGYFYDRRELQTLFINSAEAKFDGRTNANEFALGGLEAYLGLMILFGQMD
jgi:hypothetical protein